MENPQVCSMPSNDRFVTMPDTHSWNVTSTSTLSEAECDDSAKQSTENSHKEWRNIVYTRSKTYYKFNKENLKALSQSEEFSAMAEDFEKKLNKYLPTRLRRIQPPKKYILPYMNESTLPVHITVIRSLYKIWILQNTIIFIAGFIDIYTSGWYCPYKSDYENTCTLIFSDFIAKLIVFFCIFPAVSYYSYIYSPFMALRNHSSFHCIVFVIYSMAWILTAVIITFG